HPRRQRRRLLTVAGAADASRWAAASGRNVGGVTVDVEALANEIDAALAAAGTPERAEQERAYLKSSLTHYGTTVPGIRKVVKAVVAQHRDLTHDELVALVAALWE